ncbi:high mobility group protein HMGI-C isoform X2 [Alexandromys fortis]|uniref:high mobility group protein HMGI-C isoform X2 n=1 Tax=Alexandromys fortis TaxID=100897 RepID=UPI002152266D|nr:high mobility group protein HMGI-C isoform X2 [Microtus fortis]
MQPFPWQGWFCSLLGGPGCEVGTWLLQIRVSISCPWAVSCWHGTTQSIHYLPVISLSPNPSALPGWGLAPDTAGDSVPKATFAPQQVVQKKPAQEETEETSSQESAEED